MNMFKLTLCVFATLTITTISSFIYYSLKVIHFVFDTVLLNKLMDLSNMINAKARVLMRRMEAK